MPFARYIVSNMSRASARSSSVTSLDGRGILAQNRVAEDANVENAHVVAVSRLECRARRRADDLRDTSAFDDEARFGGLDRHAIVEAVGAAVLRRLANVDRPRR